MNGKSELSQQSFLNLAAPSLGQLFLQSGPYSLRIATSDADRQAAMRLRFQVFNLELNEGLESAFATGCDSDEFDAVCDHLIVENAIGEVVGTYRLQTGAAAAANLGYYSEREFDFRRPYAGLRREMVELGRACVHSEHRSTEVLFLLWKGVVRYALAAGCRYFIGCCSLTSQDAAEAAAVHKRLLSYQVEPQFRTEPLPAFALPMQITDVLPQEPPKLLRAYLAIGAKICGMPAIDREFKTIDFLTLLDLESMHPRIRTKLAETEAPQAQALRP